MNKTKNLFYVTVVFLLTSSFVNKDQVYLWFPNNIGVSQNCDSQQVKATFELKANSKKNIEVHSFAFIGTDCDLKANGKRIRLNDTLLVSDNHPLKFEIKYKRIKSRYQGNFRFKTNHDDYLENEIRIDYGEYFVTTASIRDGLEQQVNVTESCTDSITVYFPYGGTISSVSLYEGSTLSQTPYKSISYGLGGGGNFIKFSKADIGRYYVRFGSCHWGNEFWLAIF